MSVELDKCPQPPDGIGNNDNDHRSESHQSKLNLRPKADTVYDNLVAQTAANTTEVFASPLAVSCTFNPLFKVLFTFPSWYLFAIGLVSIFSLGWNLPPVYAPFPRNATRYSRNRT